MASFGGIKIMSENGLRIYTIHLEWIDGDGKLLCNNYTIKMRSSEIIELKDFVLFDENRELIKVVE